MASCGGGGVPGGKVKFDASDSTHSMSYAAGYEMGGRIREMGAGLDLQVVFLGLRDAAEGAEARLSDSAITSINAHLRRESRERERQRRKDAEEANMAVAKELLEKNGAVEGVVTTESGLQYSIIAKGSGPKPKLENRVKVLYHGTFPDGTVFDSAAERGEPAVFAVNDVMRIRGFTEALQLMSVGSKYKVVIPPDLAYGRRGSIRPQVAPNTALIFEIELLEIVN
jgi:FKBP-type peptidyl-prolyl cis-trans isomerase